MTTALDTPPLARRAADDLTAVRDQWGDLLAAIARPPAAEWPPREARGFLDQLATDARGEGDLDEQPAELRAGRTPLVLREHPAPLNLDALDAAMQTEAELFDLADRVADAVQRPVRRRPEVSIPSPSGRTLPTRVRMVVDQADRDDPARWRLPKHSASVTGRAASPGSRAHGLHWACVWLEGRALDEPADDLFAPMPAVLLDQIAATARAARRRVERALARDGRTTCLDEPCPWCRGPLVGITQPGGEPAVTCSTGEACGAPATLDERRRRAWHGAELVGLWAALDARQRGVEPAAA
ncbi:Lar family restriction alleviation protein [Streptomyces sp. NBC_01808]|uniref:hypothetical protein n=1 Tax=Streptomyces sp. NBC_01808 TaxID=2975947 RepID=UPI002DDC26E7|nr:hypothetical protein [Streptomyces sp. NBC_01808]WSA39486.1 Lar family restriction alleviation protein [Streptomyces sp. NBC_01808]